MIGSRYIWPSIKGGLLATIGFYLQIDIQNVPMSMLARLLEVPYCHQLKNLYRALNQALDPDPGAAALKNPARCTCKVHPVVPALSAQTFHDIHGQPSTWFATHVQSARQQRCIRAAWAQPNRPRLCPTPLLGPHLICWCRLDSPRSDHSWACKHRTCERQARRTSVLFNISPIGELAIRRYARRWTLSRAGSTWIIHSALPHVKRLGVLWCNG